MTGKDNRPEQAALLRWQAEEIARERAAQWPETIEALSPEETRRMLHELRVHQIELETQNEELRRAEVELDTARARYFDLYDLAPVGYCTLGEQGLILEANLAAADLLGVARGSLGKQPLSRFILSDDKGVYYLHRKRLFETGEPQVCEFRMLRAGAAPFWVRMGATAAQDADGALVCHAVLSDVTDRKRAEKERLDGNLRQAQKMEALGQLAGGVAHDFNNILQVVLGHCHLAMMNLPPESVSYADLEEIRRAAEHAAALTKQLLIFSRRQPLQRKDVDLNEVVADHTQMLRVLMGEDVELVVSPGKDLSLVHVDPVQIAQMLMNLCANARDAEPDGGKVTIASENVFLDSEYQKTHSWVRQGPYVLLSVSDNGNGMDKNTMSHLFEPFFTTKEPGKGTGLGLAGVYAIVKQHEGYVDVYSDVGEGATFKIYFPAGKQTEDSIEEIVEGPLVGGLETILVAEDDETIRNVTKRLLEAAGYRVLVAADGVEAARVFADNSDSISLAFLDVVMPNLGGRRVYELIKGINPAVLVLFTSGYSAHVAQRRFVMGKPMEFLQKPYKWQALLRRIRQMLDKSLQAAS